MSDFRAQFDQQKAYFHAHLQTSNATARIKKLKRLKRWILDHQEDIRKAVYADFKKPAHEADATEIHPVVSEIKDAIRHIREWMRPRPVSAPMALLTTRSKVVHEPKGTSLILAPWNFPFMLTISPLVSAVAAGCTAMLKPSEYATHTADLIERLVKDVFEPGEVTCALGDYTVAEALVALPYDHIFFTGSPQVGKKVMRAAAENLSSVTLELGGRNPVIVDASAAIKDTARKLVWGKFLNAGQSCMSPNYIMVHEKIHDRFLDALKAAYEKAYGPHKDRMQGSPDFARLISARHLERLDGIVKDAVAAGAKILIGGQTDSKENYLAPTVLCDVQPGNPVLEDELFGPVMPIMRYKDLDEALKLIRSIEKPLGLYIFSRSRRTIDTVVQGTSSGNVMINETTVAFGHPGLPFGGTNYSGIGKAHGHAGFLAFTNEKPVVRQSTLLPSTLVVHAPYKPWKSKVLNLIMRWF